MALKQAFPLFVRIPWRLGATKAWLDEIKAANEPRLRLFDVARRAADE
jgi:hypothetical protein